ncbi:MAG: CRISPR-associated DxTHG motif protein, partial [Flavobacterium sp.]|nr:CRISPR-associated DxTHG motif protein [Flavobacterium sp.]
MKFFKIFVDVTHSFRNH